MRELSWEQLIHVWILIKQSPQLIHSRSEMPFLDIPLILFPPRHYLISIIFSIHFTDSQYQGSKHPCVHYMHNKSISIKFWLTFLCHISFCTSTRWQHRLQFTLAVNSETIDHVQYLLRFIFRDYRPCIIFVEIHIQWYGMVVISLLLPFEMTLFLINTITDFMLTDTCKLSSMSIILFLIRYSSLKLWRLFLNLYLQYSVVKWLITSTWQLPRRHSPGGTTAALTGYFMFSNA